MISWPCSRYGIAPGGSTDGSGNDEAIGGTLARVLGSVAALFLGDGNDDEDEDEYETEMGYKLAVAMRLEWAKMLGLLLRRVQSEVLGAGDGAAVKSQCEAYAGSPVPLLLVRLASHFSASPVPSVDELRRERELRKKQKKQQKKKQEKTASAAAASSTSNNKPGAALFPSDETMVALAAAQGTCPEIAQAVSGHDGALRQPSRTLVFLAPVPFILFLPFR